MADQSKGGGSGSDGDKNLTYINECFEEPVKSNEEETDTVTTYFGHDGPITVINEDAIDGPPPRYDGGSTFQAYRGQAKKRDRLRTMSERSVDAFSDIVSELEEENGELNVDDGAKPPVIVTHLPHKNRAAVNNNYRREVNLKKPSPLPRRASAWSLEYDEEEAHRELILKIRKNLPLKDFGEEIRAHKDLAKFLVQPVVLMDIPDTSLETIIEKLMEKLQKDLEIDEKITGRAGKAFFTNVQPGNDSLASVDQLRETIQGVKYVPEGTIYEETWITALCVLPQLKRSHVAIARLRHPLNLGNKCEEVSFVIAIVAPKKEKFTKNAVEVGRTFSSLMSNIYFRKNLADASTEEEFKRVFREQSESFLVEARLQSVSESYADPPDDESVDDSEFPFWHFGRGVLEDLKRRIPFYWSDYVDGFVGKNTIRKVISTIFFLYFACILPDIAFGTVYQENTKGQMGVVSCIMAQTFGGLVFALFSGQPLLVLLTTAPLALYVKVIYLISEPLEVNFLALYAMVGIWNSVFLVLQGCLHASKSTEEVFAFFIALAFIADAVSATIGNHKKNYNFYPPSNESSLVNGSEDCYLSENKEESCLRPENFVLFLFLMFGTLALGLMILQFEQSQFLSATKREILADYALPIAVVAFTLVGSWAFSNINLKRFEYVAENVKVKVAPFEELTAGSILVAAGLGASLSCLFFVDQNVSASLVNSPANKLKKGTAYHWDLVLIAIINLVLSIFNLPWVHAALPHSPLHVRALADVEQHVTTLGTVHDDIVKVRETRVTTIVSHILIGLSLLIVHVLQLIPVAVLQGLFLYLGITSFAGNQLFDRMLLFFTEGSSYPPNHYVRKVPQRKLHLFTVCQLLQLGIVAFFGLAPWYYLKMIFPVLILLLLPVRHKVLTKIIEPRYLTILDSH